MLPGIHSCTISLNKTTVVSCSFKYVMAEEYVIVIRIGRPLTPSVDDQDLPHPATVTWYLNDSDYYYIDSYDDDAQYTHQSTSDAEVSSSCGLQTDHSPLQIRTTDDDSPVCTLWTEQCEVDTTSTISPIYVDCSEEADTIEHRENGNMSLY